MLINKKKLLFLLAFLILPKFANAGIVFQDNFDAQADWNKNREYQNTECVNTCATAPTGWTNYRTQDGADGPWSYPTASIQRPTGPVADHTGTGTGKTFLVYNQADPANPTSAWPGDATLVTKFSQMSEVYLQAWIRTQAGWQTSPSAMSKILRLQYYNGGGDGNTEFSNFPTGSIGPAEIFFLGTMSATAQYPSAAAYANGYRCLPLLTNYYCPDGPSFEQEDTGKYINTSTHPTVLNSWGDGGWHRYVIHVKMNTAGQSNGTLEVSYDGNVITSEVGTVEWVSSGAVPGWNILALGGNSNNPFSTHGEQWYAIDDVVVSDAPIPADYVPGGEIGPDTTAPTTIASPAGGTYSSTQTVTLTSNETATTKYCLGVGCTPTTTYSSPISISSSNTLRFYSTDTANNIEATKTENYIIDAGLFTLGETTILSTSENAGIGNILASPITLAQTATITSLSAYIDSATGNIRMGIYDATGPSGGPGNRKAFTNDTAAISGWQTISVTTPTALTAGTYWLVFTASSDSLFIRDISTSGTMKVYNPFTYAAFPATFPTSPALTTFTAKMSMYANLTTTPQGGDVTPPAAPTGLSVM